MPETQRTLAKLEWIGGHPALDFVNTLHAWAGPQAGEEYLNSYQDLLRWHRIADLLTPKQESELLRQPVSRQQQALRKARQLREAMHGIFSSLANTAPILTSDLLLLESTWKNALPCYRLIGDGTQVRGTWDFKNAPANALLGITAAKGIDLLLTGPLDRIKECPPPQGCGWLFLDKSKNRSRQWCSMKTCGNLAKIRRFRGRHHGS